MSLRINKEQETKLNDKIDRIFDMELGNQISLCMIVKNEEVNLYKCIRSFLPVVDEIIIVDTGSTDKTMECAATFKDKNVHVYQYEWNDNFSNARNFSLTKAKYKWVIWADADDIFSTNIERFLQFKKKLGIAKAYMFKIVNTNAGKRMMEFLQVRLFPRIGGLEFRWAVHENLSGSINDLGIKTEVIPGIEINHTGYGAEKSVMDFKQRRNKALLEKELHTRKDAYFFLGHYYTHFENPYYALACYLQIIREDRCEKRVIEKAKFFVGLNFQKLEIYKKALDWYDNCEDSDALYRKADCYYLMNDILEAKRYWEEYVKLGDHCSVSGNLYVHLRPKALAKLKAITIKEAKYWSTQT